jgi:hypothetical protein
MQDLLNGSSYLATARAAQGLADLLKNSRPDSRTQIEELQCIVTHAHARLQELKQQAKDAEKASLSNGRPSMPNPSISSEVAAALTDLEAAYQSLLALKHPCHHTESAS